MQVKIRSNIGTHSGLHSSPLTTVRGGPLPGTEVSLIKANVLFSASPGFIPRPEGLGLLSQLRKRYDVAWKRAQTQRKGSVPAKAPGRAQGEGTVL